MLKCYLCGEEKPLDDLFKCYFCRRICCNEHVEDDYAVCPECRKDLEADEDNAELRWVAFSKSLFPRLREHTPEEAKAYSEFIDFYFEEIEV